LLHGAFQWLQPRSPVVQEAVESARGPGHPDENLAVRANARPHEAVEAQGNPRAGKAAAASHPRAARAQAGKAVAGRVAAANPLHGGRVGDLPPASEVDGRPAEDAVVVLVVEDGLP